MLQLPWQQIKGSSRGKNRNVDTKNRLTKIYFRELIHSRSMAHVTSTRSDMMCHHGNIAAIGFLVSGFAGRDEIEVGAGERAAEKGKSAKAWEAN